MTVWIDADSCPAPVRRIVAARCQKEGIPVVFVAAIQIAAPAGYPCVRVERVPGSDQAADDRIVEVAEPGDLVVTRDIPLAARLVEKKVLVLNDRGTVYTAENVRERLSIRDFMKEVRVLGYMEKAGKTYGEKEVKAFADAFDREMTRLRRA